MRCWALVLGLVLLAPVHADAQVTTADGVRALAAGDPSLAFRILEPLAEGASPDPAAQFFLGAMYTTGAGVQSDLIRACGLYKRAAAAAHPIAEPALALADGFLNHAPIAREMCEAARTAVRSEPLPAPPDVASVRRLPRIATGEAIDAFVKGDYSKAADLLRPIAENWPGGVDETASFFMGMLYQNGLGVTRDPVRACALYSRIEPSVRFYGRLVPESLLPALDLSNERYIDCHLLSFIGFDHRFEPATFTLEPGYWIDVELAGKVPGVLVTVSYQGRREESGVGTVSSGMRFLPVEYKTLDVRGVAPGRRHFIQIVTWRRELPSLGWELAWSLFEIVRERVIPITEQTLATVEDGDRPIGDVELDRFVALRVNRDGDAEWAVLTGEKPTALIETEVERQEVRAQRDRRKAAEARVDWKLRRDGERDPSLAIIDSEDCAGLYVYGWSGERMEQIVFRSDHTALGLSTTPKVFDLAPANPRQLAVWVNVYDAPQRDFVEGCVTDIRMPEGNGTHSWGAVRGTVTIQLSPPGVRAAMPHAYKVWIQIDNAEFVSPSGRRIRANGPIFLNGLAGYFVG